MELLDRQVQKNGRKVYHDKKVLQSRALAKAT
jgi:hypothetical protein